MIESNKVCRRTHTHTVSGNVYEGDYENGVRHGHGKCNYANGVSTTESNTLIVERTHTISGDVYEGGYENDVSHGHGKCVYAYGASLDVYSLMETNALIVERTRTLFQAMSTKAVG